MSDAHTARPFSSAQPASLGAVESRLAAELRRIGSEEDAELAGVSQTGHTETYYDTADWRLHRAGHALSVRRRAGGLEIAMASLTDSLGSPAELTVDVKTDGSRPPDEIELLERAEGPLGDRIHAVRGAAPLVPIFDVHATQTRWALRRAGRALAEIVCVRHHVDPTAAGRARVRVNAGDQSFALKLARRLVGLLDDEERSVTHGRLYADANVAAPGEPDLGPTRVDADDTALAASMAVFRAQFLKWRRHEPGTRLGDDPEELHDMRVALRRLRAAIQLFEPFLPDAVLEWRDELRWVAALLGEVRDLDVQLEQLDAWRHDTEDRTGAFDELAARLTRRRGIARTRMLEGLDAPRYQRLVADFTDVLTSPVSGYGAAEAPVLLVAPAVITRRFTRVIKPGNRLRRSSPAADYHRVRIRAKALRYAIEFHRELYGRPAERFLRRLVALQEILGLHQDADVAVEWLTSEALRTDEPVSPGTAFVIGRLVERYERQAERLRGRFRAEYPKLAGARWSRLQAQMARRYEKAMALAFRVPRRRATRDDVDVDATTDGEPAGGDATAEPHE